MVKKNAHIIRERLKTVEDRLDPSNRFWTKFLFHFTSVKNAANILKSGRLISRLQVSKNYPEFEDSASPRVIDQTEDQWKDYVRFYFRPRTPTLHHNEGFRPVNSQHLHAHCPIPIYFLFDLQSIVSLPDTVFSRETLAKSSTRIYRSVDEFVNLPFELIYHDSWFGPDEKYEIIKARQAEVIYPQQLSLELLRLICCRSQAEKETLRSLLSPHLWNEWKSKIRVIGHQPVFFKKWLYVEQVTLHEDEVLLDFNVPESQHDYGPFTVHSSIVDDMSGQTRHVQTEYTQMPLQTLKYYGIRKYGIIGYQFRCEIDGNLAFLGRYQEGDIPF